MRGCERASRGASCDDDDELSVDRGDRSALRPERSTAMPQIGVLAVGLSLIACWAAAVSSAAAPTPVASATPRLLATALDTVPGDDNGDYCTQVQQQNNVDLQKMTGWWYVVETIGHRKEDRKGSGFVNLTVCPTMNIYISNEDRISMSWEDPKGTVHYNFQVQSEQDPGYWFSVGQQTGTYVTNKRLNYKQFAGSVQVLKAVASHLILRFCSLGGHHYSIVMSRIPNITDQMIGELNTVINQRGLQLWDIRRACVGAASTILSTLPLVALATSFVTLMVTLF